MSASMTDSPHTKNPVELIGDLPAGATCIVHSLTGGRAFCSRMANLGFTTGANVKVRQNYGRGPIVVALRGTLVALGRAEAARVLVLPSAAS